MDVTCEQCKAEYDFDDTLLGDKGTTVKCSKCGHVFRVLPPRREPQRSSLKVRFAHDGRIESVASLRELQQRIQQGQVSVDDELGRDGFNYRRLGDVPELKNFFARPGSSTLPPPSVPAVAPAAKVAPKRTVMGLGPGDVPPAPRMPNFGPNAAPQALAPTHPAGVTPQRTPTPNAKATIHGRAPISSAPTAPNMAIPAREAQRPQEQTPLRAQRPQEQTPQRAPQHQLPTPSGTAPTMQASPFGGTATIPAGPSYGMTSDTGRPSSANAAGTQPPMTRPRNAPAPATPSAPAPKLRIPDSVPPGSLKAPPAAAHGRALGGDSIGPGALKAVSQPQPSSAPPAGKAVRLSLEEDDQPIERSRERSSTKPLLYVGVLLALGGAGWLGASMLSRTKPTETPALAPTPEATPTTVADASSETATSSDAAVSEGADSGAAASPTAQLEPAAAPSAPEPAKESAKEPASKETAGKEATGKENAKAERKERDSSESATATREPKDYSGWVARGEQLFSKGDVSGAKSAFESAIAMRATGSEANSGMGAALLALGQAREAVPFLTRASNNGFAEASVSLGDAYRKLGQKEDAIEAYETYLARLPKGGRANYVRLQLEGLGRGAKPESNEAPAAAPAPAQDYRPAGEVSAPEPAAPKESAPPANESETTP